VKKEEINWVFKDVHWATNLLWAKVVVGFDGNMNMVRCHVCT